MIPPSALGCTSCSRAPDQSWLPELAFVEFPPGGSQASHFWEAHPALYSLCWRDLSPSPY